LLGGQLPVLRLDLHERLPLEPLKGRVEEILDLEIIPEVDIDVQAAQVSLSGHMTIRGTYLAETLTEYEWEQEPSTEEVRAERTSEPFPFEYRIPLEIVLPRHRVSDPNQLRVSVSQMDFDLASPHELELLAELVVEGVSGEEVSRPTEPTFEQVKTVPSIVLVSGQGPVQSDDAAESESPAESGEQSSAPLEAVAHDGDDASKPLDEFEVVARPKSVSAWTSDATSSYEETQEKDDLSTSVIAGFDVVSRDEMADGGPSETEKTDEATEEAGVSPGSADDSVRVMVRPNAKETSRSESTWSEWLTGAVSASAEETPADIAETAAGPTVTSQDDEKTTLDAKVGHGEEELSASEGVSVKRKEAKPTSSLSEYLAPILKGKAERFVSLRLYRVSEPEHLEDVAQQFGVSVTELMRLNRISEPTFLPPGNVLFIPIKKE